MITNDDLRVLLTEAADDAPPPSGATPFAVISRYQVRRRRRQLAGVAAASAVAVVAGVLPFTVSGTGQPDRTPVTAHADTVDVLTGPTRGDLADDTLLLEGLKALSWTTVLPPEGMPSFNPPTQSRAVVYADDTSASRTALVTGAVDGQVVGAWFTGPPGATADQMVLSNAPSPVGSDRPLIRLDTATTPNTLTVIGAPGDQVAVSDRVVVTAGGALDRDYIPLATGAGVASTVLDTTTVYGTAASVQITRAGQAIYRGAPWATQLPLELPTVPVPRVAAGADASVAVDPALVQVFVGDLVRGTAVPADELQLTTRWAQPVAGPDGKRAGAAVLTATFPSGAIFVAGGWWVDDSTGRRPSTGYCTRQLLPVGTDPGDLPIAMRCTPSTGDPAQDNTASLVVLSSVPISRLELVDGSEAIAPGYDVASSGQGFLVLTGVSETATAVRITGTSGTGQQKEIPISPYRPGGDLARYGPGTLR